MTFSTPIHTNEQSFERVLATGLPLLLVFTQRDSAHCATLDQELARLAITYEGRVLIAKINVDENPQLTQKYQIKAVPGLVFVRSREVRGSSSGALTAEQLQPALDALVRGESLPALPSGRSTPLTGPGANGSAAGAAPPGDARASGAGAPIKLTDASFDAVIRSSQPVLVDFWAAWCGPCRAIAPSVDTLAQEFAGRAIVGKLNIDENPRTAQRFNVMSIPTLLIFKGGRVAEQLVGAQPLTALRQALQRHVESRT